MGGDPSMMGGDPSMGGGLPPGGPPVSDEELIQEAEQDLEMAEHQDGPNGYVDEDEADEGDEDENGDENGEEGEDFPDDEDEEEEPEDDEDYESDDEGSDDLPPWMTGDDTSPMTPAQCRWTKNLAAVVGIGGFPPRKGEGKECR